MIIHLETFFCSNRSNVSSVQARFIPADDLLPLGIPSARVTTDKSVFSPRPLLVALPSRSLQLDNPGKNTPPDCP
ncbi:hypothetical protein JTE90_006906 [Oedothorax gibbosus]|uniref:Uncharacterized protein n=1 Tax=Oedothorax gibbosus TaxID=931172 RepID=A0AAV6VPW6_9ARAC|nr:hypothetical protein JTE90_006906 [Oedothorax gibbosus]